MPCFEGLFDTADSDRAIQGLLFTWAEWQALAKLRLHTDSTLTRLEEVTTELGTTLRHFQQNICPRYDTQELPREEAARARRRTATRKKTQASAEPSASGPRPSQAAESTGRFAAAAGRKKKQFNLSFIKLHGLGDYPATIRLFGTTDSYSTQIVSLSAFICSKLYIPLMK